MTPSRLGEKRKDRSIQAGNFNITSTEIEKLLGIKGHQPMALNKHIRDGEGSEAGKERHP